MVYRKTPLLLALVINITCTFKSDNLKNPLRKGPLHNQKMILQDQKARFKTDVVKKKKKTEEKLKNCTVSFRDEPNEKVILECQI